MFLLSIDRYHPDTETIKKVANLMRRGFVVAYATDTAYAFGVDATQREAVEKIYRLKGRAWNKQMPLIASSFTMAAQYVSFSSKAREFAKQYWPGPLTLILPVKPEGANALRVRRGDTIAIRVPDSPLARALARTLGHPITATSANRSGQPDCYDIESIRAQFAGQSLLPDGLLDSGVLPHVQPSTIVEIRGHNIHIIREGPIVLSNHTFKRAVEAGRK